MGPTKVIPKEGALYEVKTGKLVQDGLPTRAEQEAYSAQHYIVLPVVDKAGKPWVLDGQPVFCLHGTQYETVDNQKVHLARCPDCGGMGIRDDEPLVESDCIRCVQCGHEFDARLEMMET
jgi:DNA-directed RNA polymerase subunit RPC12/RpoP